VPRRPPLHRTRSRHPWRRRHVLTLGGVIVAVLAIVIAVVAIASPPHSPAPAALAGLAPTTGAATTVAGVDVTAAPTPTTTTAAALVAQLDAALVNTNACLLVRSATGTVLYRHQESVPLAPASTEKLLVAAAALDLLGPSYRFSTTVVAARPPVAGVVDELWLVGGGDPVLASPEFTAFLAASPLTGGQTVTTPIAALADQLRAAGLKAVAGGVHGDDSRYDRTRFLPSWKPSYAKEADVAPLGALEVDDGLDRWRPPSLTADPAAHSAGVLARLLAAGGVTAAQGIDATAPAPGVVLARVQSPPLGDIVTSMLRNSDNTAAELLARELDRAGGGTGTTPGGLAVVAREAAKLGLPTDGLHLDDASGLAPTDRTTCATLLAALDLGTRTRFAPMGLLSVAGRFGTLIDRFSGTPAVGHVSAKTGSIEGVAALVGRMDEHAPLEFAFLLNGTFTYKTGVAYGDRIVAALGSYTGP
jgi:D-alanyl-D-alanine carboxypeptidase/D-alanyl-D-alanine-endopeptidase (penicillin-binding protein 4)